MKKMTIRLLPLAAVSVALALSVACTGRGDGDGDTAGDGDGDGDGDAPEDQPIDIDDIVDLGDLIEQEADASAAAYAVGEPAQLLGIAQDSGERIRGHVTSVLDRLRSITENNEPAVTGETDDGRPFAIWRGTGDSNDWRLFVVRVNERRVRYLMQGKPTDGGPLAWRPVLTGIFVKSTEVERRGGGRFHLNMTELSALGVGPNLEGRIHFMFANADAERRARRIVYRAVREAGSDDIPANYAADLLRKVGTGGRFRSVLIDDVLPEVEGREILGIRVAWLAGQGGRGAAGLASLNMGDPIRIGVAHECWDADGNRTFYEDDYDDNDVDNPNGGNEEDCVTLAREEAPSDENVDDDGADYDAEVDELLADADADDVTEEEAGETDEVPAE